MHGVQAGQKRQEMPSDRRVDEVGWGDLYIGWLQSEERRGNITPHHRCKVIYYMRVNITEPKVSTGTREGLS